jgi:aconitate hydratase
MGVLPLQFLEGESYTSLGLTGFELYDIPDLDDSIKPSHHFNILAMASDGMRTKFTVACRLDSKVEIEYYKHSGILQYMLRQFLAS